MVLLQVALMRSREQDEALSFVGGEIMTGQHWLMIFSSCR